MAGGADEVQACVDTEVNLVSTARLLLLQHVRLMLVVEEFNNGLPRIAVVHVVSEARGIDDGEADWKVSVSCPCPSKISMARTLEELLLKLSLGNLNLDSLVHLLVVSSLVIGVVLDGGREERIDEGSLSKSRLASNLVPLALNLPRFN